MIDIDNLYEQGKQAVKHLHEQPCCTLEELTPYLLTAAVTMDKFGTPIIVSIDANDEDNEPSMLLNISAKFKGDRQIYTAYKYAAETKSFNREPKLRYLFNLLVDKMTESLKRYKTIYVETIDFDKCMYNPKYYKMFGLKYSIFYTQMYSTFIAAIEKICVNENKELIKVMPCKRIKRCMHCGVLLTDEDIIDKLIKPICPYCEKHHDKMSMYLSGCMPYYASVPVLMLKDMLHSKKIYTCLDNFKVNYVDDNYADDENLIETYDDNDFDGLFIVDKH